MAAQGQFSDTRTGQPAPLLPPLRGNHGKRHAIIFMIKDRILYPLISVDVGVTQTDGETTGTQISNIKIEQFIQDTEYDLSILS